MYCIKKRTVFRNALDFMIVISRLFQKWCSSGAVNALPYRRVIDFTGFSRTFQDTAVADKEYFYHGSHITL